MGKKDSLRDSDGIIKPTKEKGEPLLGPDAIMVAISSDLQHIVDLSHAERATTGKTIHSNSLSLKRVTTFRVDWQDLSLEHRKG